jgi:hypothetical protein
MGNYRRYFNYRDQTGQAVGPFPLSEIRRFAEAGVVPQDVLVTEVGREDWRPLDWRSSKSKPSQNGPSQKIEKPPPIVIDVPPRGSDARTESGTEGTGDPESPEVDLGEAGRELARDVGKGLWGCVIYPLILLGSLYLCFELIEWLYDKFWRFELDLF